MADVRYWSDWSEEKCSAHAQAARERALAYMKREIIYYYMRVPVPIGYPPCLRRGFHRTRGLPITSHSLKAFILVHGIGDREPQTYQAVGDMMAPPICREAVRQLVNKVLRRMIGQIRGRCCFGCPGARHVVNEAFPYRKGSKAATAAADLYAAWVILRTHQNSIPSGKETP